MKEYKDVCGVILAGGLSSRMGRDKAGLGINGVSMFDTILEMMRSLFNRVIIAGNRPDLSKPDSGKPDLEFFPDIYPGSSLGGLYTGLFESGSEWVFVSACDMPFPDEKIARILLENRKGYDVVVPEKPDGIEPLFAVYRKTCLLFMKDQLQKNIFKIDGFYPKVKVRYVKHFEMPDGFEKSLVNVNTPEQYASLKGSSL